MEIWQDGVLAGLAAVGLTGPETIVDIVGIVVK